MVSKCQEGAKGPKGHSGTKTGDGGSIEGSLPLNLLPNLLNLPSLLSIKCHGSVYDLISLTWQIAN